ncbi:MAG: NUDIX domain-containing protein [Romboutsia sp.]
MIDKTFGNKLDNKQYNTRIGAYAIIFGGEDRVATVKTRKENFLIGGKIEDLETHESCIKRECLEETGFNIEVKEPIEIDHELEWIDIKEIESKMYLEHQIWAINQALDKKLELKINMKL